MNPQQRSNSGLPLYLIPIMLGLCGILFAGQIANPVLQTTVIIFSVGIPLFAGGNLLARVQGRGFQSIALIAGIAMLILGAMVTVSHVGDSFFTRGEISKEVALASHWLGLISLLLGLITILVNIVRREEQIETIAGQFRFLADHMSEGFILTDRRGTIQLVNKAYTAMTGLTEGELVGQDARYMAKRLELDTVLSNIDRRQAGIVSEYEVPWTIDGEERQLWFHGTPLFDRQGQFAGTLATVRDITEQHQLSRRLERYTMGLQELVEDRTQKLFQSEERMRNLLLHMNEGFLTIDGQYRIRFANERIGRLLGLDAEAIASSDLFSYVDPPDRGKLLNLLRSTEASEEGRTQQDLLLIHEDGVLVPVMAAVAPVHESPNETARFSIVITDVRDLKGMQGELEDRARQLEEANAELRQLDRAKDGFLSNVTHELRTPLSTVRGYVEMFHSGSLGGLEGPQEAALRVMLRNVERLGTLIDEIIEFSRMEIRGIQLSHTLFNVSGLLHECADSAGPQAVTKDITLDVHVPDTPLYIWGDRNRLGQVLTILLSNAVKFSQSGDHVNLSAACQDDGLVLLSVADTGIGIDMRYHKRVFDKFFQVDAALSRRYEGAGIGLSIARNIIAAHGGHIELDSEPGRGSTFSLHFHDLFWDLNREVSVKTGSQDRRVLLIVESDEVAQGLTAVLEKSGVTVLREKSGFAGIRHLDHDVPNVLVVDEALPDLSGVAVLTRLAENLDLSHIPSVLMVSSGATPGAGDDWRQLDAQVLEKPFLPEDLIQAVHQARRVDMDPQRPPEVADTTPTVILSGADPEFGEWITSALKRREIACLHAATFEDGRSMAHDRRPCAILVDLDATTGNFDATIDPYYELAKELAVPLTVLSSLDLESSMRHADVRVLRKPFTVRSLVAAIEAKEAPPEPLETEV